MKKLSVLLLCAAAAGGAFAQQSPPKTSLKVGDMAPDFALPSTVGKPVRLSDLRGKSAVALAFFPAAFTGGCNKEMSAFQADIAHFEGAETKVFGISTDQIPSLKELSDRLRLTFPLLSDFSKRQVASDYGVLFADLGVANFATFVIDKDGRIQHIEEGRTAMDPTGAETTCARIHPGSAPNIGLSANAENSSSSSDDRANVNSPDDVDSSSDRTDASDTPPRRAYSHNEDGTRGGAVSSAGVSQSQRHPPFQNGCLRVLRTRTDNNWCSGKAAYVVEFRNVCSAPIAWKFCTQQTTGWQCGAMIAGVGDEFPSSNGIVCNATGKYTWWAIPNGLLSDLPPDPR